MTTEPTLSKMFEELWTKEDNKSFYKSTEKNRTW